jgi:hypothetical protein
MSEWRIIPVFPNYEVSEEGAIRRATPGRGTHVGRLLRTPLDSEGYPTVNLEGKPRRVHVLVAAAFCPEWTPSAEVHHRDEDKTNPRLGNLEVTPSRLAHFERHRRKHPERRRHDELNPAIRCACGCGTTFSKFDNSGRPRAYVTGHNYDRDSTGRYAPRALARR